MRRLPSAPRGTRRGSSRPGEIFLQGVKEGWSGSSLMSRRVWVRRWGLVVGGLLVSVLGIASWAQQAPEHGGHGTPEAWKFSWQV